MNGTGVYMLYNIEAFLQNPDASFSDLTLNVYTYRETISKRIEEEPQIMAQFKKDIDQQSEYRRENDQQLLKTPWRDFKRTMNLLATRRCPWVSEGKTI